MMDKRSIAKKIAKQMGLGQVLVQTIVQKTLDEIVAAIRRDGRIELRNFAVFEVVTRKARKARNPRTGDTVFVEDKYVPFFKTGKELRERLNPDGRSAGS